MKLHIEIVVSGQWGLFAEDNALIAGDMLKEDAELLCREHNNFDDLLAAVKSARNDGYTSLSCKVAAALESVIAQAEKKE